MMKYCYILLLIIISSCIPAAAQQDALFSHYMFNGMYINPAYTGSKDFVSTTLIARKQWAGIEGAPFTQIGSIHAPLAEKRIGLGAMIANDKIGITHQTDFYCSYAYHIPFDNSKLSLGLNAGFSYFKSRLSELVYWDQDDPVYETNSISNVLPNVGAGIYYYSRKFYAGLSAPQLISYDPEQPLHIETKNEVHKLSRHYYFHSGMIITTSGELKFRPSVMVKYVMNAPIQYDVNLNVLISDIIWVGASYRSSDAIVALLEYQVDKKLRIGYSYDMTISGLRKHTSGSHEIIIGYDFGINVLKMKTPRYF